MQTDATLLANNSPTLLDVTFCVCLHTLLRVVDSCCPKLETFLSFPDHQSVAKQCWIRLHGACMDCVLSTMYCRFKHYWSCSIVCAFGKISSNAHTISVEKKKKQTNKQINKQKIKLELGLRATCFFKRVIRF